VFLAVIPSYEYYLAVLHSGFAAPTHACTPYPDPHEQLRYLLIESLYDALLAFVFVTDFQLEALRSQPVRSPVRVQQLQSLLEAVERQIQSVNERYSYEVDVALKYAFLDA